MLSIRPAIKADIPVILEFIRDLAEYEREPDKAVATAEDLLRDGFTDGTAPKFRVVIAEWDSKPQASHFSSTTIPRGTDAPASIWKIFSGSRLFEVKALAKRCWSTWRRLPLKKNVRAWSGKCWIGTLRLLIS